MRQFFLYYPLQSFKLFGKHPLLFGHNIYLSENYYRQGWSLMGERRLKNMCILFEFVSSMDSVKPLPTFAKSIKLDTTQNMKLRNVFNDLDADGSGFISVEEVPGVIRTLSLYQEPIGEDDEDEASADLTSFQKEAIERSMLISMVRSHFRNC